MKLFMSVMVLLAVLRMPVVRAQELQKTSEQIVHEYLERQQQHEMELFDKKVFWFQDSVAKLRALVEERNGLFQKLNVALVDGDPELIQKAVSQIHSKAYRAYLASRYLKEKSEWLQINAAEKFQSDKISELRYLEIRNMIREAIAFVDSPLHADQAKLLDKARSAVPGYFEILKRVDASDTDFRF